VILDINGLPSKLAWHQIRAAYAAGFKDIEVRCSAKEITDEILGKRTSMAAFLHRVAQRFNGMELMPRSKTSYLIKDVSNPDPKEFTRAYERAATLVRAMYTDDGAGRAARVDNVLLYEDQLNRLVDFCERILSTSLHHSPGAIAAYTKILHSLEELGDDAKKTASEGKFRDLDALSPAIDAMIAALQSKDDTAVLRAFNIRRETRKDATMMLARNRIATVLNARQTLLHLQREICE
jgi:hypothetical protein